MARSPRKQPVAAADTAPYMRSLESLSAPLEAASLFPKPASTELEVGCGKGLFLSNAAAENPGTNYLGIEISAPYARMCAGRLSRFSAENAIVIPGDARRLVEEILADACLSAVHVYFPDPWWNARHRKRRVLAREFVEHVARVLVTGGLLHVWTDVEEYFLQTIEHVAATRLFGEPQTVIERPAEHDLDYRTHFERRTRLAGEPVWRTFFVRNASTAPPRRSAEALRPADSTSQSGRGPLPPGSDTLQ